MIKNIIFWLEFPLLHISPLIKSLSEVDGYNVIVVCEFDIPDWRLSMGFHRPSFGNASVYVSPESKERDRLVSLYSRNDCVHIFHGLRHVRNNYKCFIKLKNKPCYRALYFEPLPLSGSLKAFVRGYLYRFLFLRFKTSIDFLLALGQIGQLQYISLGFPKDKVYEFEYHVDTSKFHTNSHIENAYNPKNNIKILYAGQFVKRKNLKILIEAFSFLKTKRGDVYLELIGDGPEVSNLKKMVHNLKLQDSVSFLGVIPNDQLQYYYSNSDVFVLPSLFEGWGAVSVEAMASGMPVIISNACASESIIKEKYQGLVFNSDSSSSLTDKLNYFVENVDFYKSNRQRRVDYIKSELSGEAGRENLLSILSDIIK